MAIFSEYSVNNSIFDNMNNAIFKKGFHSICVKDPVIDGLSAHVPPIYATSTFTYEDLDKAFEFFKSGGKTENVFTYSRLGNPTVQFVANKIAALEAYNIKDDDGNALEAYGVLFGSGMAAIAAAILANVKSGDKVITQGNLYGTTNELLTSFLKDFGIETIHADLKDLNFVEDAIINDEDRKSVV